MRSEQPAVRAAGVEAAGWGWRHAGRKAAALSGVDLRIDPGERVLLLGPSGSGKSTLLAGLAGLLDPEDGHQTGRLLVDGQAAHGRRGRAGLVMQDPLAQTILARCGDDVAFGCENLGVPRERIWPRVTAALDEVGLDVALDRSTSHLSGGQRQRLALAGVLAMRPGLLLLDEPTANLDPAAVLEVRDAVSRVLDATGATLVVVEHRVQAWLPLVDRVVVLGRGGVLAADGPVGRVLADQGAQLMADGVWVPGHTPPLPTRRPDPARLHRPALLTGRALTVGRHGRAVTGGLDVALTAGACLAVTGPSGTGKSTLALTMAGLLPALDGQVLAADGLRARPGRRPLPPDPARWRARDLATRIGVVFQEPEHQFVTGTVRDEVLHGLRLAGVTGPAADRQAGDLLERLRLAALARANPFTLSGGEKRRLSVAGVLAARSRLLVLDEPTFGQDAATWAELVALLAGLLDDGLGALMVTHDQDACRALADATLTLDTHPAAA